MLLLWRRAGDPLFPAGPICEWNGVPRHSGPMSDAVGLHAREAARMCALNLLHGIRDAAGSLDTVEGVMRLGGFVPAPPGRADGPAVIDGASPLLASLHGERGEHARTAVRVSGLSDQVVLPRG